MVHRVITWIITNVYLNNIQEQYLNNCFYQLISEYAKFHKSIYANMKCFVQHDDYVFWKIKTIHAFIKQNILITNQQEIVYG